MHFICKLNMFMANEENLSDPHKSKGPFEGSDWG